MTPPQVLLSIVSITLTVIALDQARNKTGPSSLLVGTIVAIIALNLLWTYQDYFTT